MPWSHQQDTKTRLLHMTQVLCRPGHSTTSHTTISPNILPAQAYTRPLGSESSRFPRGKKDLPACYISQPFLFFSLAMTLSSKQQNIPRSPHSFRTTALFLIRLTGGRLRELHASGVYAAGERRHCDVVLVARAEARDWVLHCGWCMGVWYGVGCHMLMIEQLFCVTNFVS
jgi:hypothetical protein